MKILYAIGIVLGLIILYVIGSTLNKKTPVPEGCENLKVNCDACGIQSCMVRNKNKGEE
ncbi:MAG: hypothetical protein IKE51_00855 [Solobacterium sp.]|nr:hypothetical protein [Solobacterium sp.]